MMSKKQQTNATNEANLSAYMEVKGIAPEDRDVLPFGNEPKAGTPYDLSVFLSVMGSRLSTDEDHDFHRRAVEGFRCLNKKQADNWISVNYQLPPPEDVDSHDSDFVLCYDGRPFVDRYSYFVEGRMPVRVTGWESGRKPTHWQPLPNPPAK